MEEKIKRQITKYRGTEQYQTMEVAQRYYRNQGDILHRVREYLDRRGVKVEIASLSNARLAHPYMRKLTLQKVNYLLSKELTLQTDNEALASVLRGHFTHEFLNVLKSLGKDAVVNGLAWLQVYYDDEGKLKFKRIPPREIVPVWADIEHRDLERVIREIYEENDKGETVRILEVYDADAKYRFSDDGKGKMLLESESSHFTNYDEKVNWGKPPFVCFRYNDDEMSLLTSIKSLVDDYDLHRSTLSNEIQDVPNSIKKVKNYDGTDKNEFMQNLALFRTAFVSGDGDIEMLLTPIDSDAIMAHIKRLRKDIFDAGNGVDAQSEDLGIASGVALRFRYLDLDGDCQGMANEFNKSLRQLIWFIMHDEGMKGMDFTEESIEIIFNTDTIVNEMELIQGAAVSDGIISRETIMSNHPWVRDVKEEMRRVQSEQDLAYDDWDTLEQVGNSNSVTGRGVHGSVPEEAE